MTGRIARRSILKGAAGLVGAGLMARWPDVGSAWAKEKIVGVEWGGTYIESIKALAAKLPDVDVEWQLHTGGAGAILAKIQATWPKVQYDLIAAWDPVFISMIKEGWLETVTLDEVPNLKDVPQSLILTDAAGNWKTIPQSIDATLWGYREDACPIKIQHIEDLLDPKLKGQIIFPDPVLNSNMQMVMLALARGGDEHNMEPGWEFMKELAKSGNIGRLAHADNEVITSLTTGEGSVTYADAVDLASIGKNFPMKYLSRVSGDKGLKATLFSTGWVVLRGGNTRGAFEFANFTMSPENDEAFNTAIGNVPTNAKSKPPKGLEFLQFNDDEIKEYTYRPDWSYVTQHVDEWQKRWEKEIVPLLQL